jgi:hypothetical protein
MADNQIVALGQSIFVGMESGSDDISLVAATTQSLRDALTPITVILPKDAKKLQ